jgi:hypothetical protein
MEGNMKFYSYENTDYLSYIVISFVLIMFIFIWFQKWLFVFLCIAIVFLGILLDNYLTKQVLKEMEQTIKNGESQLN